jgi:hypothetical protein
VEDETRSTMNRTLLIETLPLIGRFTRTAPLGLRFWDDVTGKVIADGLVVTAYVPGSPLRRIEASPNRAGVYVLSGLPGMRDVEFGSGDRTFWDAPPARATFRIEVVDAERRFQPFLLTVDAPVKGVVSWSDPFEASPPAFSRGIPLHSTASRSVPAAMAVIRAELRQWRADPNHEGDAARWAVVEARIGARRIARGVADEKGRVALIFAYPEPVTHALGSPPAISPPGAEGPSLRDQQWTLELSASFDKLSPAPPFPGAPALPELSDVLGQSPATLWADSLRNEVLSEVVLSFGQELVVRSIDRETNRPRSVLFISAAGSPP